MPAKKSKARKSPSKSKPKASSSRKKKTSKKTSAVMSRKSSTSRKSSSNTRSKTTSKTTTPSPVTPSIYQASPRPVGQTQSSPSGQYTPRPERPGQPLLSVHDNIPRYGQSPNPVKPESQHKPYGTTPRDDEHKPSNDRSFNRPGFEHNRNRDRDQERDRDAA